VSLVPDSFFLNIGAVWCFTRQICFCGLLSIICFRTTSMGIRDLRNARLGLRACIITGAMEEGESSGPPPPTDAPSGAPSATEGAVGHLPVMAMPETVRWFSSVSLGDRHSVSWTWTYFYIQNPWIITNDVDRENMYLFLYFLNVLPT